MGLGIEDAIASGTEELKTTSQGSFWHVAVRPEDLEHYPFLLRLGCVVHFG
jgi:hypothetical protein